MTSQKSLKNNVISNDFKRSLTGSVIFPAIAFIVLFVFLTIPVIQYVTRDEFVQARVHTEISMFLAPSSTFQYMFYLLPVGMVLCGMLTAIKSFSFLMLKKQVNVFLSLGVTRNTLLTNRTLSAVIMLFAATFIPIFTIYVINIVSFGISVHLTELFLFLLSLLFVCGITGYAIATAAIMITGNLFETALTTFSFTVFPLIVNYTVMAFSSSFLKGYVTKVESGIVFLFTPWTIGQNIFGRTVNNGYVEHIGPENLLYVLQRDTVPEKYKIPEELCVNLGFTLPIILWAVLSVVFIGLAYYLFNKRKAEHANSLGKFPFSRAIVSTLAFTVISWFVCEMLYNVHPAIVIIAMLAAAFTGYCLVQLILSRNLKSVAHSLKWFAALATVLVITFVAFVTGFFGTYNKIPDKADVKSVSIEMSALSGYSHYIYPWDSSENFVEGTSDESKEAVLKAYKLLADEKTEYGKDCIDHIRLAIRDKDGKVTYRGFDIFKEETYMQYLNLIYGSDFHDKILENYLIEEISEYPDRDSTGFLRQFIWAYVDESMIFDTSAGDLNYITDTTDLCKALYEDLSAMSVEELLRNPEAPIGYLGYMYPDSDFLGLAAANVNTIYPPIDENYDGVYYEEVYIINEMGEKIEPEYKYALASDAIPVYSSMKNTVKYLTDNGYMTDLQLTVKEVLYSDGPLSIQNAKAQYATVNEKNYKGWGTAENMFFETSELFFDDTAIYRNSNEMMGYFLTEKMTERDLILEIYKVAGHPLTSVTDSAEAKKIADKTVTDFLVLGDEGRYVYIIYEEGPVVCRYLPAVNTSVIK